MCEYVFICIYIYILAGKFAELSDSEAKQAFRLVVNKLEVGCEQYSV